MAGSSLLALLDDIATLLDDISVMTKVAAKKTAGVLGDDLAVNAEGGFTFATAVIDGGAYAVSVAIQPAGQTSPCFSVNCRASTMRSASSTFLPSGKSFISACLMTPSLSMRNRSSPEVIFMVSRWLWPWIFFVWRFRNLLTFRNVVSSDWSTPS